jgi:hypothetical protein
MGTDGWPGECVAYRADVRGSPHYVLAYTASWDQPPDPEKAAPV